MPLLRDLEFCQRDLAVAYRASAAPQELLIEAITPRRARVPMAPTSLRTLLEAINGGAAGGSVFPPSAGFAERLDGPWDGADILGPVYRWTLRVAGVAPLFVRNLVEELRRVGMEQPVSSLRITGSLPVDATPMSVREHDVRAWIEDRTAYLDAWPSPGFPIASAHPSRGATLRLDLAAQLSPALRNELEGLSVWWLNHVRNHVSEEGGDEVMPSPAQMLPSFGSGKTEFRARYEHFPYARGPSRALLVGMLTRLHEKVVPLAGAEIGL